MKRRNVLRCPNCGAEILTTSYSRTCYKCDHQMEFIRTEGGKTNEEDN